MQAFFSSLTERVSLWLWLARDWLRGWKQRPVAKRAMVAVGVSTASIVMMTGSALAAPELFNWRDGALSQIFGWFLNFINFLIFMLDSLLILLNMLLMWLLVQFASFNNFVGARPVQIGWPIIRDVTNMFFIIVLLVVAFSTIIGYQSFHYKGVLPKLLLMTILINFSKTFVGLMIDFSQVITLTFVSGFRQASFGNFVKAFGFEKYFDLAMQNASGPDASASASKLMISLILGMIFLTIIATVMTILMFYFLFRIVTLWVLLIVSPLAFFVLALPDKMGKMLGPVSKGWWSKLGAALTGGPIMAFFLWLTLALIQESSDQAFDKALYIPDGSMPSLGVTGMTQPGNITTMFVAIVILMIGLQTAIEQSNELSHSLGELAKGVKSKGGPAGVLGRFADKKLGVTKRVSKGLNRMATEPTQLLGKYSGGNTKVGGWINQKFDKGVTGVASALGGTGATLAVMKGADYVGKQSKAYANDEKDFVKKSLEGKSASERWARLQILARGNSQQQDVAEEMLVKERLDGNKKALIDADTAKFVEAGHSKDEAKILATNKWKAETAAATAALMSKMKEKGNDEGYKEFEEKIKKGGGVLYQDPKDLLKYMDSVKPGDVTADMTGDSMWTMAYLEAQGLIDASGRVAPNVMTNDNIKKIAGKGGEVRSNLLATLNRLRSSDGATIIAEGREAFKTGKLDVAQRARMTTVKSDDGSVYSVGNQVHSIKQYRKNDIVNGRMRVENADDAVASLASNPALQASARTIIQSSGIDVSNAMYEPLTERQARVLEQTNAVRTSGPGPSGSFTPPQQAVIEQGQRAGLPSEFGAFYSKQTGTYAPGASEAHQVSMKKAVEGLKLRDTDNASYQANVEYLSGLDTEALTQGKEYLVNVAKAFEANPKAVSQFIFAVGSDPDPARRTKLVKVIQAMQKGYAQVPEGERNPDVYKALMRGMKVARKSTRERIEKTT